MPWDGDDAGAIRHYDVLPLARHMETDFFQRSDGPLMGYSRNCLGSTLENHFAFFGSAAQLVGYREVFFDCLADVFECFGFGLTL
jgi:hypothetical protein